jgi:ATP-dependent DNA ligase
MCFMVGLIGQANHYSLCRDGGSPNLSDKNDALGFENRFPIRTGCSRSNGTASGVSVFRQRRGASRLAKRNTFQSFPRLCEGLARDLKGRRCVLDDEIVCLDQHGKSQFNNLLFRRGEPFFYAFDLLWEEHAWSDDEQERRRFRNGKDLRYLPLCDRKLRLRAVAPKHGERLLYCDHVEADGEGLFQLAREHDLEGIVAKDKRAPYLPGGETTWFKIRNRGYSQWVGREELFERERVAGLG